MRKLSTEEKIPNSREKSQLKRKFSAEEKITNLRDNYLLKRKLLT